MILVNMIKVQPQLLGAFISTFILSLLVMTTTFVVMASPIISENQLRERQLSAQIIMATTCVQKCVPGTNTLVSIVLLTYLKSYSY